MKVFLLHFFLIITSLFFPCVAQEDDVLTAVKKTSSKEVIDSLLNVVDHYWFSDPSNAIKNATAAHKLSEANLYEIRMAQSLFKLGVLYNHIGDFDQAMKSFEKTLDLSKKIEDSLWMIKCYNEIGLTYQKTNNYSKALENLTYALGKAQDLHVESELNHINVNIAKVLFDQGNYILSIGYLEPLLQKNLDNTTKAAVNNNIGRAYKELKNIDKAIAHYMISYKVCLDIKNNPCELKPLGNMANIYLERHEYDKALGHFLEIATIEEKLDLKSDLISTYNSIGIVYRMKKDFSKSLSFLNKSEKIAKEIKSLYQLKTIYLSQALAYEDAGKYIKALDYLYAHRALSDSLFTIEKNKQLSELLVKYEAEKKEKEISLLKKNKELQSTKIAKQYLLQKVTALGIAFLLLTVLGIVYVYRQKLKSTEILSSKNEEINKQKTLKLIHDHEINTTKSYITWQENERQRISLELHDGVAASVAAIKLSLLKIVEEHHPKLQLDHLLKTVDNTYDEIRTISHHLSPPRVVNTPFIDLIENYLKEIGSANSFQVSFLCNPRQEINLIPDEMKVEIYRIMQEVMTNVVKHANCNLVEIQFTGNNDHLNILIEDDGKGFNVNKTSFGIGLGNIKSRVLTLDGSIHIDSSVGRGSIINIDLPVNLLPV